MIYVITIYNTFYTKRLKYYKGKNCYQMKVQHQKLQPCDKTI